MAAAYWIVAEILNDDSFNIDWIDVLEDTNLFITSTIDFCHLNLIYLGTDLTLSQV